MDTLHENAPMDTSPELFGKKFRYPFFAGPVGAVDMHYSDKYDDLAYNNLLVDACAKAGGGTEGVQCYVDKLGAELADTMAMCGASTLSGISGEMIWRP